MNIACKLLLIVSVAPLYCNACPSCVGAVNQDSEPFFSDDCYKDKQPPSAQSTNKQSEKGVQHE